MSQVDSVEIDGRTVRGSATFVRQGSLFGGEVETMNGTFEATCGAERTAEADHLRPAAAAGRACAVD